MIQVNNIGRLYENLSVDKDTLKYPVLYTKKEECCGCAACFAICPKSAINMEADEEGFLYPVVDLNKCIGCFKCVKICSFKL